MKDFVTNVNICVAKCSVRYFGWVLRVCLFFAVNVADRQLVRLDTTADCIPSVVMYYRESTLKGKQSQLLVCNWESCRLAYYHVLLLLAHGR